MPKRTPRRAAKGRAGREVEYVIGKGTSRLLEARVDKTAIRLYVNGPAMLVGSARVLTSLDFADGATYQAWQRLANALTCTFPALIGRFAKVMVYVPTALRVAVIAPPAELYERSGLGE